MAAVDPGVQVQQIASKTAKDIQKMINSANTATLKANASESAKARTFNKQEAATARAFNANEAKLARQFNAAEAKKSRDWQTQMSNTSHQREVADLKKAGLNPVLSAGTGAQSYTTSSASANAASSSGIGSSLESGAGALGNLFTGLMSTISSMANAKTSATAQLEAARTNAAANIQAANTSASAIRYSADQSYAASRYASDTQYRIAMDRPVSNVFGFMDKYYGNQIAQSSKEGINDVVKALTGNPDDYFSNDGTVTKNNFILKNIGKNIINKQLQRMNLGVSDYTRNLFIKSFVFGDSSATNTLKRFIDSSKNHKNYY